MPCNIVVQQAKEGVEVFSIDPAPSMSSIDNAWLSGRGRSVGEHLRAAVEEVARGRQH